MITRFQGPDGHPRLIAALRAQQCVHNDEDLAKELANLVDLVQIEPGKPESTFIKQGDSDNDIFLILTGKVSVVVNGREKARRKTGQHVGEMAAIDPSARRSADVVAIEQTVLARISEPAFSKLASKYPDLWRRLALEIAERLRQRGLEVQPPNDKPHIFIGSSVEALPIARELQAGLAHDPFVVRLWTDGVFRASRDSVDSLVAAVKKADFAILVLTADDTLISREVEHRAPRDNCIFELGLFMGALGRDRTFIIKPRGIDIKLPTDLLGITPLEYAEGTEDTIAARVGPVCTAVRKTVQNLGPK
ncbi:MAG: nucleotide-binding protein [Verrucomicrobiaceae bacterium]|nr:nucleotide-binding protein [Verrucomicrobiaceae bacterium]